MSKFPRIRAKEARRITLYSQALMANSWPVGQTSARVLEHLTYVQIDTISVLARAHDHVLFTRIPNGQSLATLVGRGLAFEYWSHAASFLPKSEFRYSLLRKQRYLSGEYHWFRETSVHKKLRPQILKRIEKEGPLSSRDFESKNKKSGWFERSPEKQVLEQLFMEGKLMIRARNGFQKIYDLTERVFPESVSITVPTRQEFADHFVKSQILANGFMSFEDLCYLRTNWKKEIADALQRGIDSKRISTLEVEGGEYFCWTDNWEKTMEASKSAKFRTLILSPFDNLLIRRKRFERLFGFPYVLECYVPEKKRKWGYFCLPVILEGEMVALLDIRVDRKKRDYECKKFHSIDPKKKKEIWKRLEPTLESLVQFSLKLGEKNFISCEEENPSLA